MTAQPHVASVRLPLDVAAQVLWSPEDYNPDPVHARAPTTRWMLRWTVAPAARAPSLFDVAELPPVVSIGLNASGAGLARGDMTLNTEWALYRRWGRTELVKLNLFDTIATIPLDLLKFGAGSSAYADFVVAKVVELHRERGALVLATWGGPYSPGPLGALVLRRAEQVLAGLEAAQVPVHVLGLTAGGQPRHIRGIGRDAQPLPWRVP